VQGEPFSRTSVFGVEPENDTGLSVDEHRHAAGARLATLQRALARLLDVAKARATSRGT
jgi:hypothetical protein